MEIALFFLIFLVGGLAVFVWWLLMLIESLRIPGHAWQSAGHNQILYVVLMVLLGVIGTILYVLIPRKELPRPGAA